MANITKASRYVNRRGAPSTLSAIILGTQSTTGGGSGSTSAHNDLVGLQG